MKNNKKRVLTALMSLCMASTICCGFGENVSASSWHSFSVVKSVTSNCSETYVGGVTIAGEQVSNTYYDANIFGVRSHDDSSSRGFKHTAGISSNGKSKWSEESTATNLYSGRVSKSSSVNVMAMVYN